jgi:adenylosuccinate lyase
MVESLNGVIDGAEIRRDRMLQNLSSGLGLHAASRLLTALVDTGMQRDAAYSIVQAAAASARDGNRQLHEVCLADTRITAALNSAELLALFDHRAATVHAALLVDRLGQLETRG